MEDVLNKIKKTILEVARRYNIEIDKIILFGSRARGDYREESDWDILIVTKEKLDWRVRKKFLGEILRIFAKRNMRVDTLIIDSNNLEEYKNWEGFVYHYAVEEGLKI